MPISAFSVRLSIARMGFRYHTAYLVSRPSGPNGHASRLGPRISVRVYSGPYASVATIGNGAALYRAPFGCRYVFYATASACARAVLRLKAGICTGSAPSNSGVMDAPKGLLTCNSLRYATDGRTPKALKTRHAMAARPPSKVGGFKRRDGTNS